MKALPRATFEQAVKRHNADRGIKKFRNWNHLVAMLYGQLSGVVGLRGLEAGFNSHLASHYHLGVGTVKRATLADANENRSIAVFSDTAAWLMQQVSRTVRKDASELMYLLDSTSVTLKGREYDRWTAQERTRNTQGIKLHLLLDASTQAPSWHDFSAPNVNDIEMANHVQIETGALYVFDKGYYDYNWWNHIDSKGARFVTRFKSNAALIEVEQREIPSDATGSILEDRIVRFKNRRPGGHRVNEYRKPLRWVTVDRPDKARPMMLATNDMESSALEIAQRYKERWAIELFFKWIKQHLKIKQFFGRSENAVRIQILTALISYLLVVLYKDRNMPKESLWQCLCHVTATLFQRFAAEESWYQRRRSDDLYAAQMQPDLFH